MIASHDNDQDRDIDDGKDIHSKSWFRWFPETAEQFEFSADKLSEDAKTVNSSMCERNKGQEEGLLPFYS